MSTDFETLLRTAGSKVTPGRLALLKTLHKERRPVPVSYLEKKLTKNLDRVSLYRALDALVGAGIVTSIDFHHGHSHFELAVERPHHHHIVCTSCDTIEDTLCDMTPILAAVAKQSKKFAQVTNHSTEFFGLCRVCAR
ncbi:MAG: Fur family transcriptional regulator, ferric uptake regulator [Patescibacteria group bacterium]|jgi:Fur family ferric uptake transcriptional regulator|nr:Fur family transcriptional regulator, ferric uptake regulator [Patescibacteria group bacterium]